MERICDILKRLIVLSALIWTCLSSSVAQASWSKPAIVSGLLCIHKFEGSWTDDSGTYRGGLQMNENFERSYGPSFYRRWGRSGKWPKWAQLQAGVNGALARSGFNPWPTTRVFCNLPKFF